MRNAVAKQARCSPSTPAVERLLYWPAAPSRPPNCAHDGPNARRFDGLAARTLRSAEQRGRCCACFLTASGRVQERVTRRFATWSRAHSRRTCSASCCSSASGTACRRAGASGPELAWRCHSPPTGCACASKPPQPGTSASTALGHRRWATGDAVAPWRRASGSCASAVCACQAQASFCMAGTAPRNGAHHIRQVSRACGDGATAVCGPFLPRRASRSRARVVGP